jgi:hypothetical protein
VEKIPFSGITEIIGTAIDTKEHFSKVTPVFRKDSPVFCLRVVKRDRA